MVSWWLLEGVTVAHCPTIRQHLPVHNTSRCSYKATTNGFRVSTS